jgi:hypothetical protein
MARRSHDFLVDEHAVQRQLQRKSSHRRKELLQLAKASAAPQARRNDPVPQLELVSIGLDDLKLAARKIRKCTPAHVRELMGSISELGFCAPILVGKDNLVIRFHGVISLGATTPILFVETTWRLRHLQIPTTPATGTDGEKPCDSRFYDQKN